MSAFTPHSYAEVTTAIHYVKDDPHIGHMYENIMVDAIARHRRRMSDDVRFLTAPVGPAKFSRSPAATWRLSCFQR